MFGIIISIGWKSLPSLLEKIKCISVDKNHLYYYEFPHLSKLENSQRPAKV